MDRLYYKYLAPLLAISILPILLTSIVFFVLFNQNIQQLEKNLTNEMSSSLRNEVSAKNEQMARAEGLYIEEQVDRLGNKLSAVVLSAGFIELDEELINTYVGNIINSEPAIMEFTVVNQWGDVIYRKESALSLVSNEIGSIKRNNAFEVIESGQSYISDVQISNKTQLPYINMGQPILDYGGEFQGGVFIMVDLKFVWDMVESKQIGEEGYMYIVSESGNLISHPETREIYQNSDYSKYEHINTILQQQNGTVKNEAQLLSFFTNRYNWTTIIEQPLNEALAPVEQNRVSIGSFISSTLNSIGYSTVTIVLLVLAVSILSGVYITRRIIHPIVDLTTATKKISEGDLNLHIEKSSNDEIGDLTDSFNAMTAELKRKQDELVKSNEYIKEQAEELLERYNSDLEQFAYVTTHDLIEPLRMITSYVQLLQRRYSSNFDDNASEYMRYVTEGVERMHAIINDLFEYSHIRTNVKDFEPVPLLEVFEHVMDKLEKEIDESDAQITCAELPRVKGMPSNLTQLFQNLVANAIKFKHPDRRPEIFVDVEDRGREWLFTVKDNGIGFDEAYSDKIFEIFKRLNKRDEYPGSGMGLAICKNIVERHGGKIWADSVPNQGTTFFFTLKKY